MIRYILLIVLMVPALFALDANSYSTLIAAQCADDTRCIALTKAFIMERSGANANYVSAKGCAGLLPICYQEALTVFSKVQDCCPISHDLLMRSQAKSCSDAPLCTDDDRLLPEKNLAISIPLLISQLHTSKDNLALLILTQEVGSFDAFSLPPLQKYLGDEVIKRFEAKGLSFIAASHASAS